MIMRNVHSELMMALVLRSARIMCQEHKCNCLSKEDAQVLLGVLDDLHEEICLELDLDLTPIVKKLKSIAEGK
jgi:hypothetical protein